MRMTLSRHSQDMSQVKSTTIKAQLDQVGPVSESMADAAVPSDDDQDLHFRINIALTEAITNSVVHGCDNKGSDLIRVEYELQGENHVFHIFDPGKGPCPELLERPVLSEDPLAESHRGMVIMKWAADEMNYKRENDCFCLSMLFRSRKTAG